MTDEKLVAHFIEKNYTFGGFNEDLLKFVVIDKHNDDILSQKSFIYSISNSFNNFKISDRLPIDEFCNRWFNTKMNDVMLDINDFLRRKVRVTLGQTSWEVSYFNGNPFNVDMLIDMYKHKYTRELIKMAYDRWHTDSVIAVTEKTMNFF